MYNHCFLCSKSSRNVLHNVVQQREASNHIHQEAVLGVQILQEKGICVSEGVLISSVLRAPAITQKRPSQTHSGYFTLSETLNWTSIQTCEHLQLWKTASLFSIAFPFLKECDNKAICPAPFGAVIKSLEIMHFTETVSDLDLWQSTKISLSSLFVSVNHYLTLDSNHIV